MDSRRSVLKKILVGTAGVAVPGASASALEAVGNLAAGEAGTRFALPTGPAPWWLIAPVGPGTPLGLGWYVGDLSAVERGAAVLTLRNTSGDQARVHLCAHNGRPRGVAYSQMVDLVLMDGGTGSERTNERLGRVVLGLAERIRQNEISPAGDLSSVARMMTHDDRLGVYGPEALG